MGATVILSRFPVWVGQKTGGANTTHELTPKRSCVSGDAPPVLLVVDGIAKSLVALDGGLAVGFETELLAVHPHCPAGPLRSR